VHISDEYSLVFFSASNYIQTYHNKDIHVPGTLLRVIEKFAKQRLYFYLYLYYFFIFTLGYLSNCFYRCQMHHNSVLQCISDVMLNENKKNLNLNLYSLLFGDIYIMLI